MQNIFSGYSNICGTVDWFSFPPTMCSYCPQSLWNSTLKAVELNVIIQDGGYISNPSWLSFSLDFHGDFYLLVPSLEYSINIYKCCNPCGQITSVSSNYLSQSLGLRAISAGTSRSSMVTTWKIGYPTVTSCTSLYRCQLDDVSFDSVHLIHITSPVVQSGSKLSIMSSMSKAFVLRDWCGD